MTTKRLALLGIAALVACSNSSTPLDLSALDLSGRWTLLDSATARQVDTDVVYATVVARGTVVLAALGAGTYTMSEAFALHFTLIAGRPCRDRPERDGMWPRRLPLYAPRISSPSLLLYRNAPPRQTVVPVQRTVRKSPRAWLFSFQPLNCSCTVTPASTSTGACDASQN